MNLEKCILPLILFFYTIVVNAQNDTLKKSDTSNLKVAVLKKDFINSKMDLSKLHNITYNHKLYNPDIYRSENVYNPFITSWPYPSWPYSNYSLFNLRNNLYRSFDPLIPLIGQTDPTNLWFDPTNPSGATSAGDFLILGTLNYLFSKVVTGV
jgi:hypothetical protein